MMGCGGLGLGAGSGPGDRVVRGWGFPQSQLFTPAEWLPQPDFTFSQCLSSFCLWTIVIPLESVSVWSFLGDQLSNFLCVSTDWNKLISTAYLFPNLVICPDFRRNKNYVKDYLFDKFDKILLWGTPDWAWPDRTCITSCPGVAIFNVNLNFSRLQKIKVISTEPSSCQVKFN